jgi:cupin superfamily protein
MTSTPKTESGPAAEPNRPAQEIRVHVRGAEPLAPPWTFASIIRPLTPAEFCSEYWGERPLHLARGRADYYSGLITLAEVERYLSMQEIFTRHSVTMPRQGDGVPDRPPGSISELFERLIDGSSLRIRRMECFMHPSAPVISLLREMESALGHPLSSLSCYVAPPNAIGLGPHHDETEIFTLQISGMKRWRLYHRVDTDRPGIHAPEQLGEPAHDLMLEAGDLLYLPRGWVHEVTSTAPAFSLTIVFDPIKWSAVLDFLVAKLGATGPFMAPMPAGVFLGRERPDSLRRGLAARIELIREALQAMSLDDVVDDIAPKVVGRMTLPPDAQLDALLRLDEITLETVVAKRPGVAYHLTRRADRVVLFLPGGYRLQASERAEPALVSILAAEGPFRVAELHDVLGGPAKLALARKLVTCGLLRVVRRD